MGGERMRRRVGLGLAGDQLSEVGAELLRGGFLAGEDAMSLVDGDAGVDRTVAGLAARCGRRRTGRFDRG
jgi:hypothetical protein